MRSASFETFAKMAADAAVSHLEAAGRYGFQADAEQRIAADVACKLNLQPHDRLLDIGCGPGNLLLPLARLVAEATAIDNAAAIDRLRVRAGAGTSIRAIAGDFLQIDLSGRRYEKILVYSVIQYLASPAEVLDFVTRAASLLAPGGRLLCGDVPNATKKARFLESAAGRRLAADWKHQAASGAGSIHELASNSSLVSIDDALVLKLAADLRSAGYESYVLPQPPDLPFGWTREDVLVVAHD